MASHSEIKEQALRISIQGVTKTYGDFFALNNVSLDIEAGEFLTLLGPSGSGKTTLLMVLAGFIRPNHGQVFFGSEDIVLKPPHLRGVGMVFQNYALFPHMSVEQNVAYPLKLRRKTKDEISQGVQEALDTVKLAGLGNRKIGQLSGGQRQRVALARAIVFKPKVLLMDEPLSALDKKLREEMQIELRRLHDNLAITTVYVTHDQKEALTMSDRIAVINHGILNQLGLPQEIYSNPTNAFIADFIGESTLLPVEVRDSTPRFGESIISVNHDVGSDGSYVLVVRPEKLLLVTHESTAPNRFPCTVEESIFQGESQLLIVRLDAMKSGDKEPYRLNVRIANTSANSAVIPQVGDSICVALEKVDSFIVKQE